MRSEVNTDLDDINTANQYVLYVIILYYIM